jgi:hypothetical protein
MHLSEGLDNGFGKRTVSIIKFLFKPYNLLVFFAFLIGFILRVWDFGNLPAGLSEDEASIGVEAASLHNYGIDRNGISYPIHFISWGGGQNALYGYLLAPLVTLGQSPFIIRLPMLISGLLTLAIVYGIARKLFTPSIALMAIFLLAISPWHIMMSRWALESNLFPFVFSMAFLCLLNVDRNPVWFLVSMALLAISLYSYGTAYFLVPLFVFLIAAFFYMKPFVSRKILFIGIALFIFVSIPIFLFILVNTFQLDEIHLGIITIPRVISSPRIVEMTGFLHGAGFNWYYYNLLTTAKIMFLHTDGLTYNAIPPFGFLFPGAVLFALVGAFLAGEKFIKQKNFGMWAFGVWLILSFLLGIIQPPDINRINIIFIPLILCVAMTLDWLVRDRKLLVIPIALGLGAYAILFWREYTGSDYRSSVGWGFNDGLIPAIQSVMKYPDLPVCITNEMDMPYIYVQLIDFRNPKEYLAGIKYYKPIAKYRYVIKMDRYSFGIQNCDLTINTIYILKNDQQLPIDESYFTTHDYGDYVVYIPKTAQ